MRQKAGTRESSSERLVKNIRREIRKYDRISWVATSGAAECLGMDKTKLYTLTAESRIPAKGVGTATWP